MTNITEPTRQLVRESITIMEGEIRHLETDIKQRREIIEAHQEWISGRTARLTALRAGIAELDQLVQS